MAPNLMKPDPIYPSTWVDLKSRLVGRILLLTLSCLFPLDVYVLLLHFLIDFVGVNKHAIVYFFQIPTKPPNMGNLVFTMFFFA